MSSKLSTAPVPEEKVKHKLRRVKANGRERQRMYGLNHALDKLRMHVPISTSHQKLSKIETLKLARNYINALNRILATPSPVSSLEFAHLLAPGMSQTTTNMIASHYQVQPRALIKNNQMNKHEQEYFIPSPSFTQCSPFQVFPENNFNSPQFNQFHDYPITSSSDSSFEIQKQIPEQCAYSTSFPQH